MSFPLYRFVQSQTEHQVDSSRYEMKKAFVMKALKPDNSTHYSAIEGMK